MLGNWGTRTSVHMRSGGSYLRGTAGLCVCVCVCVNHSVMYKCVFSILYDVMFNKLIHIQVVDTHFKFIITPRG